MPEHEATRMLLKGRGLSAASGLLHVQASWKDSPWICVLKQRNGQSTPARAEKVAASIL